MPVPLTTWIAVPVLGGVIGYLTNRIAVKMIFRPIQPVRVLGIKVQGLIGRRQQDLADRIGAVVGDHLVQHDDVIASLQKVDLESLLADVLERGMGPKVQELRNIPLVGNFLTDERLQDLRASMVRSILKHRQLIYERMERAVEQGLDVEDMVRDRVAAFPVEKLEALVLQVAARELRAIELLGGVLGTLIGVIQVVIVWLLS